MSVKVRKDIKITYQGKQYRKGDTINAGITEFPENWVEEIRTVRADEPEKKEEVKDNGFNKNTNKDLGGKKRNVLDS